MTDRADYEKLSQPLADEDAIMAFELTDEIEKVLGSDSGSEEDDNDAEMEDPPSEEDVDETLLHQADLHDGEAHEVQALIESGAKVRRTSSVDAERKVRKVAVDEAAAPFAGVSDDEEGGCYKEDDENKGKNAKLKYDYGHEEVPGSGDEADANFVVDDAPTVGLSYENPEKDFLPSNRKRREAYLRARQGLRKLAPGTEIFPADEKTMRGPKYPILVADEHDFEQFCVVCTMAYHELLLGVSFSSRKTAIEKETLERYTRAQVALTNRMLQAGTNILVRVSDHNFGVSSKTEAIRGKHPWYVTWKSVNHSVDMRCSRKIQPCPTDGYCCVTGSVIPVGAPCYIAGLVRKEIDSKSAGDLRPVYLLVSRYTEENPTGYLQFLQSAYTLWNFQARIVDWMKDWKEENPVPTSQVEEGPDLLMGSDRGRTKLGLLYLELKSHASLVQTMLDKAK